MDYEKDFTKSRFNSSLGSLYYLHHYGDGQTIIFLHGLGANTRSYFRLMKELPQDLDVYLLDLLGHGKSAAPSVQYTVQMQAGLVNELVVEKSLDPVIFGHSYGGWVAAKYASQGLACKALVLEDAAGAVELYEDIEAKGGMKEYKEGIVAEAKRLDANIEVINSIVGHDFEADALTAGDFAKIAVPTLVLWGSEDDRIPIDYGMLMNARIPGSSLAVVQGATHTPHYVNAPETARAFMAFLSKLKR